MTLYTQAESNIRKTWLFITLFLIFIIGLGWVFSRVFQNPVILIYAVIFSLLMNLASFWYSDKIVLVLAKAKPIEKQDNPELYRIVENLCITAGLPLPKIYIIESPQINAFATGRNPKHAAIAVTRGALEKLQNEELEGVLAHELSHIGNRDILVSTVAVVLAGLISMLANWFMRWGMFGGRRDGDRDSGGNAVVMAIGIVAVILAPIAAMLIQLAVSRKREYLADASGALLTRYPEGLASALEKIGHDAIPLKTATKGTAHLYISNPFKAGTWSNLFSTHPPIEQRVKALRDMNL